MDRDRSQGEEEMKQVIAVAAGVLLVGSMVSSAFAEVIFTSKFAEVTFSGDARERLVWNQNTNFDKDTKDVNYGRLRIKIDGTTKGGAYFKTRLLLAQGHYNSAGAGESTDGVHTDYAYIGIPAGPVTIEAGRTPDNASLWFLYDKRFDRISATYANKTTKVVVLYDKRQEYVDTPAYDLDRTTDQDINGWGVIIDQKIGDWDAFLLGYSEENQISGEKNGEMGTFRVMGPAGPVSLLAEVSFKSEVINDVNGPNVLDANGKGTKSGYGGIVHAKMTFGQSSATLIGGFTKNGFEADVNYGFQMIGGAMAGSGSYLAHYGSVGSGLTVPAVSQIGKGGDWIFGGAVTEYKVSKMITLIGTVAYAHVKDYANFTEVSGQARFDVVEGAYITLSGGALTPSSIKDNVVIPNDKTAYGVELELGIYF